MEEKKQEDLESTTETTVEIPWINKLDKLGIELRGIERVPPHERTLDAQQTSTTRQLITVFGLWFAGCGGVTSMSSFFLPTLVFGLNLKNALISGLVALNFGCLVPAYCSLMGPKSGCRQVVSARFVFGYWGVKIVALICVVGLVGWSVVNLVVGGQMFKAAFGLRLEIGIVIISVVSLVVAVFGIKVVLKFQTILSIPIIIANILLYVVVFKKIGAIPESNRLVEAEGLDNLTFSGNWITFFTIGFSVTSTWGGCSSDYYIIFPEDTPSWKIFSVTFFGIAIPTTLVATVGTVCGAVAFGIPEWMETYEDTGIGGLIYKSYSVWGNFGKFLVVVLFMSLICNNVINSYSGAFDLQLIDSYLALVPRWAYALLITVVALVLSIVGKNNVADIMSNFLPMLGYWITIYIAVLLEENFIFRTKWMMHLHHKEFSDIGTETEEEIESKKDYLYNWTAWNDQSRITHGLAAMGSFVVGAAAAVVGMNQTYFQGPAAKAIGDYGGDIGFFLAFASAGLFYAPARYYELKKFGK